MAGKHTYGCFGCGVEKKKVNHWWLVWFINPAGDREFSMREWDEALAMNDAAILTICGQACAIKMMDRFMSGQPAPPDPTAEGQPTSAVPDTTDQSSTAQDRPSSSESQAPGDTSQDPASSTSTEARPPESQVDTGSEVVADSTPHSSDQTTDPSGAVTGIS